MNIQYVNVFRLRFKISLENRFGIRDIWEFSRKIRKYTTRTIVCIIPIVGST